jgi:hypothetical protein
MLKVWCRGLLSIPVGVLGLLLCLGKTANAESIEPATQSVFAEQSIQSAQAEQPQYVAQVSEVSEVSSQTNTDNADLDYLAQMQRYSRESVGISSISNENRLSQVTSVSQLTDVQPTDWAFTALQSLVERYGCIAGYPDRTYRGQRAMTRYEFAAGLNACLDKINEIISSGLADKVSKEDLAALQRLQEEFAAELAALRGRVDALEAKTAQLEAQQFSTTTKLSGLAFFNLTGATGDNILREIGQRDAFGNPISEVVGNDPNITMSGLVWLDLKTSFTGDDLLITQLAAGNGTSPANTYVSAGKFNSDGTPYFDQTSGSAANEFILRELSYSFPAFGGKTRFVVGPRVNFYKYFEANRFTLLFNGVGSFNAIDSTFLSIVNRGAGAVLLQPLGDKFDFHLGYLAESNEFFTSNSASNPDEGLFGGTNILAAELTFKPSDRFNIRFLYARTNIQARDGLVSGEPIRGLADDGFGGAVNNSQSNTYAVNMDWLIADKFGVFGRYGFTDTNINPSDGSVPKGNIEAQMFQVGFAVLDLFKEGARGTVSFLMPYDITSGRENLVSGGGDGSTSYELEAAYYLPLTKNIAIVPNIQYIWNFNNFSGNDVFVGNLRTQFNF